MIRDSWQKLTSKMPWTGRAAQTSIEIKKYKPKTTPRLFEKSMAESIEHSHKLIQSAHDRIQRSRITKEKIQELIAAIRKQKRCVS